MAQAARVSYSFASLADTQLDDFTGGVLAGMTGNTSYPTPNPTMAALGTLKSDFETALANASQGGTANTAAKNSARDALVGGLRLEANGVEGAAGGDLAVLLTSGFQAVSTNRAQSVLDKVQVFALENGQTGELKARIKTVPNAKSFDGRIKGPTGDYSAAQSFASSRDIVFDGLTPGTVYMVQVCAIGGLTGRSD